MEWRGPHERRLGSKGSHRSFETLCDSLGTHLGSKIYMKIFLHIYILIRTHGIHSHASPHNSTSTRLECRKSL